MPPKPLEILWITALEVIADVIESPLRHTLTIVIARQLHLIADDEIHLLRVVIEKE